jgi:rhodanese-related sulfurtransferase
MTKQNGTPVSAKTLKSWVHDGKEIALLDVREHGQYGEEHLFYVVSTPYSKLEAEVDRLVGRKDVRMVLVGDDSGDLSRKACMRLAAHGYTNLHYLDGGMAAWKAAGLEVFAGVNLPSKAFGELAEHAFDTPRITAQELNEKIKNKENMVILDGRPYTEYRKMSIPTAMCCPNGELPLRIDDIVTSPETTIVINCAGRTRSIIGAQTLINLGIKNKVLALENGTQGWYLADFALDHGAVKRHPLTVDPAAAKQRQARARELAKKHHVPFVSGEQVQKWLAQTDRTTFLCDVRTPEEFAQGSIPGAQHTPGGQLVQATDQYVGVRGARLVLFDSDGARAPAMASWLAMLGWEVAVCDDALQFNWNQTASSNAVVKTALEKISATQLKDVLASETPVLDLRVSTKYREGHVRGSKWTIRPLLANQTFLKGKSVVLFVDDIVVAELAALDLIELGVSNVRVCMATKEQCVAAGLEWVATPDEPTDAQSIDYLFFVHDRHDGNKAAARQYLAWEMNLLAQIDEQERDAFKLPH